MNSKQFRAYWEEVKEVLKTLKQIMLGVMAFFLIINLILITVVVAVLPFALLFIYSISISYFLLWGYEKFILKTEGN